MLTFVRELQRRVVVVGTLVLLSMLAAASPANAVHLPLGDWTYYNKYVYTGKCREVGEDLSHQGRIGAFKCIPYANSRRVDLWVRYYIRAE